MPMSIPIEPGQQFQSAVPEEDVLIQVIHLGGLHRPGEVFVGTVSNVNGKLLRQRWAKADRFHDSMTLGTSGHRRRTGWVLVQS